MKGSWNSQHYKKYSNSQTERALKHLNNILFNKTDTVLDIGCGVGEITEIIASKVSQGNVLGIDISKNMINYAQNHYANISNLNFKTADVLDFTAPNSFDCITSFNALHWVTDHDKMLKNVKISLKPDGQILFLMAHGKKEPPIDDIVFKDTWKPYLTRLHTFRKKMSELNYDKLLHDNGFKKIKLEFFDEKHLFSNIQDLENQIMTWLPYVANLEKIQCVQLAKELSESFASYSTIDNMIVYSVPMMLIHATVN